MSYTDLLKREKEGSLIVNRFKFEFYYKFKFLYKRIMTHPFSDGTGFKTDLH